MSRATRVLYVDDDPHSLELRKTLLERVGDFDVLTETDPKAALSRLDSGESIDCLLSDLEMPDMDGLEFLQAVRERDAELPFIMFTAKDNNDAVEAALDSGATDFIPKSTASLSYRLVARRIEQAVELVVDDTETPVEPDKGDRGVAASIESAIANEQVAADDTENRNEGIHLNQEATCPVPGCSFEGDSRPELLEHFAGFVDGEDLTARLHRVLQRRITGSRPREFDGHRHGLATESKTRQKGSDRPDQRIIEALQSHPTTADRPRKSSDRRRSTSDGDRLSQTVTTAKRRRSRRPSHGRSPREKNRQSQFEEPHAPLSRLSEDEIEAIARTVTRHLQEKQDRTVRESTAIQPDARDEAAPTTEQSDSFAATAKASPGDQETTRLSEADHRDDEPFELSFEFDRESAEPASEPSEEPPTTSEDVPTLDPKPGEAVLFACGTHDADRDALCDTALGIDEATDSDIILIRYRAIDEDRLERLATTANRITLISIGHEQEVPSNLSDWVENKSISKVTDLRRLGIMVTRTIEEWKGDESDIRVCIDSLNVALRYADAERVFRFLHLLLGKLGSVDGITHSHIDPSSETPRDLNMLETLYDRVVTLEDDDSVGSQPFTH